MDNEVLAVLIRTRAYLERGWVQWAAAVNAEGTPCSTLSAGAVRWCLTAAAARAAYDLGQGPAMDREYQARFEATLAALAPACLLDDREKGDWLSRLVRYNDQLGRTQAAVLAAVEATIKRLEQGGAP